MLNLNEDHQIENQVETQNLHFTLNFDCYSSFTFLILSNIGFFNNSYADGLKTGLNYNIYSKRDINPGEIF